MTHILPSLQHRESLHFNTQPGICRPHLNTQDTITAVVHVQRHNFETPAQNSLQSYSPPARDSRKSIGNSIDWAICHPPARARKREQSQERTEGDQRLRPMPSAKTGPIGRPTAPQHATLLSPPKARHRYPQHNRKLRHRQPSRQHA